MRNVLLNTLALVTSTHALFECVGTNTGACEDDAICCQDDAKCYPFAAVAADRKLCVYSCTCTAGDKVCATLPCYNAKKSLQLPCFGKTCGGHGECASGSCYCDRGWGGENCAAIECINNCNGESHGKCVAGVCKCKDNWQGEDCSLPVCPEGCSGHGECSCTNEECTCKCAFQWRGAACGEPGCPSTTKESSCSGHGECEREGGNLHDESKKFGCRCDAGWHGADCGEQTCPRDCMKRGECRDGKCFCKATHSGDGCQHRNLCGPDCGRYGQKYGRCNNDQNKCMCEQGWEGFDCLFKSPTPADCQSGRTVKMSSSSSSSSLLSISEKKRVMRGVVGATSAGAGAVDDSASQEPVVNCGEDLRDRNGLVSEAGECPNACTDPDRGVCIQGVCVCKPGFSGSSCAGLQCPNGCSGKGLCDPLTGGCTCDEGMSGNDCSALSCLPFSNPCEGHGTCRDGKCICSPPFVGTSCESKVCPIGRGKLECSGNGMCGLDGACHCPPGRGGLACEKDVCLNECSGVGLCRNEQCFCPEGYSGDDCSTRECPSKGCSGHGKCSSKTGVCACDGGYTGEGCEGSVCEHDCGANGECNGETKKCDYSSGVNGENMVLNEVHHVGPKVSFKQVDTILQSKMTLSQCATGCSDKCAKVSDVSAMTTCNVDCTRSCLSSSKV